MDWYAEAEFAAHATDEAIEAVAPAFVATYYNSTNKVLRLRQQMAVEDYEAAARRAEQWILTDALPAAQRLDPQARIVRVTIESAEAVTRLVGTADFAKLLGVSPTRVRQLADLPGFPQAQETSAGAVWPRDVAETYAARRAPRSKGGRPRKGESGS